MLKKNISEITSILNIYSRILENKKIIFEQDIFGIDELVHNPVTGFGGELGYGYDRGKRIPGITWPGHGGHLHVGFTDKNTAMAVMDKAQSLGLRTAENPYSMTHYVDPNLHTRGPKPGVEDDSFHHQRFEGSPEVGKGVDITGSHKKLVELILWIEQTFAGNVVTPPISSDNESDVDATAGALAVAGAYKMAQKALSSKSSSPSSSTQSTNSSTSTGSFPTLGRAQKHSYGGGEVLF